jgi:hypothetical protein
MWWNIHDQRDYRDMRCGGFDFFSSENSSFIRTPQNWNIQLTRMQMKTRDVWLFPQPANQRSLAFK